MPPVTLLIDALAAETKLRLPEWGFEEPLIVGIHTGGAWVATALHQALDIDTPLGLLDISFYRDDFSRIGLHPQVKPTELPVQIDDRPVLLVDDVLHTGRTIRAALNALFEYGRPSAVRLAVLVDRPGRELPIRPDVVGTRLHLADNDHIKLNGPDPLALTVVRRDD